MVTIRQWLENIGLERYSTILESEEVDVESLPHVTVEDLKELGIPLGPHRRILGTVSSEIEKADTTRTSTPESISGNTRLLSPTTPTEPRSTPVQSNNCNRRTGAEASCMKLQKTETPRKLISKKWPGSIQKNGRSKRGQGVRYGQ